MRKRVLAGLIGLALIGMTTSQANASQLTYNISMDNGFDLYLSTNDSIQGSYLGSGNSWSTTFQGTSFTLAPGQDYYLHVYGYDQGVVAGFLGEFSLTGTDHEFSNNTGNLLTDTVNWQASGGGWNAYNTPTSWGTNGVGPWGTRPNIGNNATWIWYGTNVSGDPGFDATTYYTTKISATTSPTPEPATMMLLCLGLAGGVAGKKYRKAEKQLQNCRL